VDDTAAMINSSKTHRLIAKSSAALEWFILAMTISFAAAQRLQRRGRFLFLIVLRVPAKHLFNRITAVIVEIHS
jgi:hypothetical protein